MSMRGELEDATLLEYLKYIKFKEKGQREDFDQAKDVSKKFLKFLELESRGEPPIDQHALQFFMELLKYTSASFPENHYLEDSLTEYSDMDYFCIDHPEYRRKCLVQIRSALIKAYAEHVKNETQISLGRDVEITKKIKPHVGYSFFRTKFRNMFGRGQQENEQWMK